MKHALSALLLAFVFSTAAQAQERSRAVTVSGQGEVMVEPDRARLNLTVDTLRADLQDAEKETNRIVRAYLSELKTLGLKDEQIDTAGVSVSPEYVWDDKARRQKLTGYHARREINLRIDQLAQLGPAIQKAVHVGITQINPPALESSRSAELTQQALAKAAKDARAKAQVLADTLDVKLGAVRTVNAQDDHPAPMPKMMMARMAGADAAMSNESMGLVTGQIRYQAQITAEFDLIAP